MKLIVHICLAVPTQVTLEDLHRQWRLISRDGVLTRDYRSRVSMRSTLVREDVALSVEEAVPRLPDESDPARMRTYLQPGRLQEVACLGSLERSFGEVRVRRSQGLVDVREDNSNFDGAKWTWKRHFSSFAERNLATSPVPTIIGDYFGELIGFPRSPIRRFYFGLEGPVNLFDVLRDPRFQIRSENELVEGEPCILLERPDYDRLWLARDKGLALVKREFCWHPKGPIKRRITNSDFRNVHGEIWMPYKLKAEYFGSPATAPGKLCAVFDYTVELIDFNVKPEWFDITRDLPEGTQVRDHVERVYYVVGRDENGNFKKINVQPLDQPRWRPIDWFGWAGNPWVWTGAGVILIALALYLRWRWLRQAALPSRRRA